MPDKFLRQWRHRRQNPKHCLCAHISIPHTPKYMQRINNKPCSIEAGGIQSIYYINNMVYTWVLTTLLLWGFCSISGDFDNKCPHAHYRVLWNCLLHTCHHISSICIATEGCSMYSRIALLKPDYVCPSTTTT